jgi:hypothetical protein
VGVEVGVLAATTGVEVLTGRGVDVGTGVLVVETAVTTIVPRISG